MKSWYVIKSTENPKVLKSICSFWSFWPLNIFIGKNGFLSYCCDLDSLLPALFTVNALSIIKRLYVG